MKAWVLVFLGGGTGSVFRFLLSNLLTKLSVGFPIGTLCVNALGSLIIGFCYTCFVKNLIGEDLRLLLMVGLCGGFTTFSAFSYEGLQLCKNGLFIQFAIYIVGSILLCMGMVWLGDLIGRAIH